MAEFGFEATQLPAVQGRGTQPLSPVQRQVTSYSLPQGILDIGVGFLKEHTKAKKEESPILKNLNDQLFALDRAQIEGRMSYGEAYTRRRALTASALNAAGGDVDLYDNIKKLYTSYSEMTTFEEGVDQRKAIKERNSMIQKGMLEKGFYVDPNGSDKYFEDMGKFLASINKSEADFKQKVDVLNYTASEYNLDQRVLEDKTKAAVQEWVMDNTVPVSNLLFSTATELKTQVDNGIISHEDARVALRASMRVPMEQLTAIAASHPEAARGLRDYIGNMSKDLEDILLDPNTTLERLEREIKTKELQAQAIMMSDGNVVGAVAMTNLLKNNPAALAVVNASVVKAFSDIASPMRGEDGIKVLGDLMESAKAGEAFTVLKAMTKDYDNSENKELVDKAVNAFLKFGSDLGPNGDRTFSLRKSKEAIDFLATPEFAMWRKKGGALDEEALDGTRQMFENVYLAEIQTPLNSILTSEVSSFADPYALGSLTSGYAEELPEKISFLDAFVVEWTPGGVRFNAREIAGAGGLANLVTKNFVEEKQKAEKLVNKMLRAGANIDGVTMEEYWEENKHLILPVYFTPDPEFKNLKVGDVINGREYLGGAPESPYSWK